MPQINPATLSANQKGQTLIEVAVVLLLISLCISGTMMTILKSQQVSRLAIQYSDAMILASSLIDKMYRNKQAFYQKKNSYLTKINAQSAIKIQCTQLNHCASQRQALTDLNDFKKQLLEKLPNYFVEICRDNSPDSDSSKVDSSCDNEFSSNVAIKIWWEVPGINSSQNMFYTTSLNIF